MKMTKKKPHPTRGKKLPRDLLDDAELDALLTACGDGDAAHRNRAFIAILVATGIRISEALDLETKDIDLGKRTVHVCQGKNGKGRYVWMHADALPLLKEWNRIREEIGLRNAPVFCNLKGGRMHDSYLRAYLPELGRLAKIKKRVHAHGLRHVFACKAHKAHISLRTLQLQFGHESIATTSQYLEGLGLQDAFDEFDRIFVDK
jgi:site-specific recombinase XerD